jgi:hypothetical protein
MGRRLIATAAVAITVIGGCSTPPPTPVPSDAASRSAAANPSDAAPPSAAASPDDEGGFWARPPNPRNLQPTLAASSTASADMGWAGGTIEASGPAGASYRLEIPPEALPVQTTITMTPLSELTGFGSLDASLEHMLGVELEPEGLQLLVPATLTMMPAVALPPAGIATGDYLGHGEDAGLLLADTTDTTITFEISHFSGYWSIWPLEMEDWRVFENDMQRAKETAVRSQIGKFLMVQRQLQLAGLLPRETSISEVARNLLREFDVEEEFLQGRLALADNGCFEAQAAIQGYLVYDQLLQMLGVADDPELYDQFRQPIPDDLFTVVWNLCLDEEYQRCAATGDWPRLARFLLSQDRQRALWDFPLTAEQIADGKDRLERCGRWRVELTTNQELLDPIHLVDAEFASEILVRFRPDGDLPFGLSAADVGHGFADVEVSKLEVTELGQQATLRGIQEKTRAGARITGMTFATPIDGSEPIAITLKLWVDPGSVAGELFKEVDYGIFPNPGWEAFEVSWAPGSHLMFRAYPPEITGDWRFQDSPYSAEFARTCPPGSHLEGVTVHCDIEVIVEHAPGSGPIEEP